MTEEQISAYKMRIAQAGIAEYTVIMLEMEMQWIEEALGAFKKKETETFISCTDKAQAVQLELMNVMNTENPTSADIYSVFVFINKELINAKIKREPLDMARCKEMLAKYHASFKEIAGADNGGPVMAGSEKVYAGLTYGTGGLVESSVGGTEYTV